MTVACPHCGGAGGREIGAHGHRGWSPDRVCGGTGRVTPDHAARILGGAEARRMRHEQDATLAEVAARHGWTPWERERYEQGDGPPA